MIFVTGFVIALVASKTPKKIYTALIMIPKFMFFQVVSLIQMRSANEISIATEHYHKKTKDIRETEGSV